MKGLVVEKQARCRIVLTPTGEYKKIHGALGGEIGQEISVRPYFTASKVAVLAAVLVIVILLSQALPVILGQNRAYAYVTLDINPSAEFAVDADYLVLSARPYNPEAENILSGLEYIGKRIDSVLAEFTHSAISLRYIGSGKQNRVVVSFYSAHTKDEQSVEAELKRSPACARRSRAKSSTTSCAGSDAASWGSPATWSRRTKSCTPCAT